MAYGVSIYMATVRKKIPEKLRAALQQEIDSKCPFCSNIEVGHFQVHHIDENPDNNLDENLLMLCSICHSKITKGDISPNEVKGVKRTLINYRNLKTTQQPNQTNNFSGNVVQPVFGSGNTINNVIPPKPPKNKYPHGCIGSDVFKNNYISYLIDRFHEYKEWEVGKENMRYALFPSQLKKKFKIGTQRTIYNVPIERFEELALEIQSKIDGTKLGRIKAAKGQLKNYQYFVEYVESQNGSP